jgi:hypothetical protein
MPLAGEKAARDPIENTGSGVVREKQKAYLSEIIERVNSLFEGELTEEDKLVYVKDVIMGKLLGIEDASAAGREQHERAVRVFADTHDRDHRRHHGRDGSTRRDEQAGAELQGGPGGHQGYPAELRGPMGGATSARRRSRAHIAATTNACSLRGDRSSSDEAR